MGQITIVNECLQINHKFHLLFQPSHPVVAALRDGAVPVEDGDLGLLLIDLDREADPGVGRVRELHRVPGGVRDEGHGALVVAGADKELQRV